MESNPYDSPGHEGGVVERTRGVWKRAVLTVLAVVVVMVMLVALLLPAVRTPREVTRRAQCNNNLKQIGLALHNYAAEHGALPPAYTVDAEGNRLHSWRTLILPFMEQQALYDKIDLTKPWDDPANQEAFAADPYSYRCPSANLPSSHTTYLAIVGPGSCLQPVEPRKLSKITDDPNSTIMVMEANAERAVHWMSPVDAGEQDVLEFETAAALPHPGGATVLYVDGEVRFLMEGTDPAVLRAMISIDGGDDAIIREAFEGM